MKHPLLTFVFLATTSAGMWGYTFYGAHMYNTKEQVPYLPPIIPLMYSIVMLPTIIKAREESLEKKLNSQK